jgi:hypothetical protein
LAWEDACAQTTNAANVTARICLSFMCRLDAQRSCFRRTNIRRQKRKRRVATSFLNRVSFKCRAAGETEPGNDCLSNSGCCVRLHCCPCEPGSSLCKTQDDHHVVQMGQSLVGRSRSRSQVCHGKKKPADNRSLPHLGRSSLPDGKACSAWGSNNRVLKKTPDPQR